MNSRRTVALLVTGGVALGVAACSGDPALPVTTVAPSAAQSSPAATTTPATPSVAVSSLASPAPGETTPTSTASTNPSPAPTPAASTAGSLEEAVFAKAVGRWKAVPGGGDEGTYQPNGTWVHALAPEQVTDGLAMQACTEPPALPRPRHVLASDYEDAELRRAVGQALEFANPAEASRFLAAYRRLVQGCVGQQNPMAVTMLDGDAELVDRRVMLADDSAWVEVVRLHGATVELFAANEQDEPLSAAQVKAVVDAV